MYIRYIRIFYCTCLHACEYSQIGPRASPECTYTITRCVCVCVRVPIYVRDKFALANFGPSARLQQTPSAQAQELTVGVHSSLPAKEEKNLRLQ